MSDISISKFNDATVYEVGDVPADHLDRRVRYCVGRNRFSTSYRINDGSKGTVRHVLAMLSQHVETGAAKEDLPLTFFGNLARLKWQDKKGLPRNTRRRKREHVIGIDFIGFDFDSGATFDSVFDAIRERGVMGVVYTTISHATEAPRIRAIIPLSETWTVDMSKDVRDEMARYDATYEAAAAPLGFVPDNGDMVGPGLRYDPACADMVEGFYTPYHRPDSPYRVAVNVGRSLVLPAVTIAERQRRKLTARKAVSERNSDTDSPLRRAFGRLLKDHGDVFDVCGFIDAIGWPVVNWSGSDKAIIECPNRDAHSNSDDDNDAGCVALSPNSEGQEFAAVRCQHGHCNPLASSDLLAMICEAIEIDGDPIRIAGGFVNE